MFQIELQKGLNKSFSFIQTLSVDSLYEAELKALEFAIKHYESKSIMLVHTGELTYDIYETFEPIGQIKIFTK